MQLTDNAVVINGSFLAQPPTGVQRFAIEISIELKRLAPHVTIVAPKNTIPSAATDALNPEIIGKFTGHRWEQIDLWWYARTKKALLLNLDMKGPLLYRNKIITIHDLNFLHNPRWVSRRFYYFYKFLTMAGAHTSRLVLTVSEFSKAEIQRFLRVPASRIEVVYNAVTKLDAATDKDRPVPGDYILSVSSTHPRKNLKRLMRAFRQLRPDNVTLVLVGLPHSDDLSRMTYENIVFLGHVEDKVLVSLYRQALAFVYPSLYEGFGIPPLEAMSFGCPVVASHASSILEVCGDAVLYVDPNNVDNITDGLDRIIRDKDLRNELAEKGLKQCKNFSWTKSAAELAEKLTNSLPPQ